MFCTQPVDRMLESRSDEGSWLRVRSLKLGPDIHGRLRFCLSGPSLSLLIVTACQMTTPSQKMRIHVKGNV